MLRQAGVGAWICFGTHLANAVPLMKLLSLAHPSASVEVCTSTCCAATDKCYKDVNGTDACCAQSGWTRVVKCGWMGGEVRRCQQWEGAQTNPFVLIQATSFPRQWFTTLASHAQPQLQTTLCVATSAAQSAATQQGRTAAQEVSAPAYLCGWE